MFCACVSALANYWLNTRVLENRPYTVLLISDSY